MTECVSGSQKYRHLRDEEENFWVDNQTFLLGRGYQLRPRYHPDWIPSWTVAQNRYNQYEDNLDINSICALDATRIDDGKKVILKRVLNDGHELGIIKYLNTPSVRSDPRNRTIPLLDIIPLPDSPCDIAPQNMMMDETRVIPKGSHFSNPRTHTGFYDLFSWNDRCTVGPVDYYYIDFGLSLYFPDGEDAALYVGTLRTFPTIPELSQTVPYNPFKVDIFQLGLTIHNLIDAYPELEEFRPVVDNMTAKNPNDRPNPLDASTQLRGIATAWHCYCVALLLRGIATAWHCYCDATFQAE
ncbi:hypothetical protein DFH09DRAFT_1069021 [Mycena vulgaris]|nr:hypothetical protein DFH09DRAFT_1069021 [Mycena vulgaris]